MKQNKRTEPFMMISNWKKLWDPRLIQKLSVVMVERQQNVIRHIRLCSKASILPPTNQTVVQTVT